MNRHPFLLSVEEVARQLDTNIEHGLSARQVVELRNRYPSNELEGGEGVAWYTILVKQVSNALILASSLPYLPLHPFLRSHINKFIGPCFCHGFEFRLYRLH